MSAKALLSNFTRAGFRLTVRGEKIWVTPVPVPQNIVELIRENKPALMNYLKGEAINMPGYPVEDGPFTPWCCPLSPDEVQAIRVEIVGLIEKLSEVEGWPNSDRDRAIQATRRQPLSTLRDDLAHFRARWKTHAVVQRAAEVGRNAVAKHDANRKCSTCEHRREWPYGVPVRCEVGRALPQAHHRWLVASDDLNPCREHTLKRDKT